MRAIGFDFGDDDSEPDIKGTTRLPTKLSTLGTLSSSLLVFGSVLKGAVGEAFLATVAMANKYQASNKARSCHFHLKSRIAWMSHGRSPPPMPPSPCILEYQSVHRLLLFVNLAVRHT